MDHPVEGRPIAMDLHSGLSFGRHSRQFFWSFLSLNHRCFLLAKFNLSFQLVSCLEWGSRHDCLDRLEAAPLNPPAKTAPPALFAIAVDEDMLENQPRLLSPEAPS